MDVSRRDLLTGLGSVSLLSLPSLSTATSASGAAAQRVTLPDRASFPLEGVYVEPAHPPPLGGEPYQAAAQFLASRRQDADRKWPRSNARDAAVGLFAKLINAEPAEIAVVPSTMEGENLVVAALALSNTAGVVTDALHYDASLVLYGELHRRGVPLSVVAPRQGRIELTDIEAVIDKQTRLVAVSLVSSSTGFVHDLKALCDLVHSRGALVYADVIQAAGAVPIDVRASEVDFCCCGTYKWLMGDFGTAFLYVRPDRLAHLARVQVGWRQIRTQVSHALPYDPPGPLLGEWTLGSDTASVFEVSTPAWGSLATVVGGLSYVHRIGVHAIVRHRQPLIDRLQDRLPTHGFAPLTPTDSQGPIVAFACRGAARRFDSKLAAANIRISTHDNRIRLSPSVYNDMEDVERVISVLSEL